MVILKQILIFIIDYTDSHCDAWRLKIAKVIMIDSHPNFK